MPESLTQDALHQLFLSARTHNAWQPREVPHDLLRQLIDLMKMAPTSVNCSPARITFVTSADAKARLKPHLLSGNVDKTMQAPVTAIIATDYRFYDHLPKLFPHTDARSWFTGNKDFADLSAFRNASLQGGYFILAARSLGLDCGPMWIQQCWFGSGILPRQRHQVKFPLQLGLRRCVWPASPFTTIYLRRDGTDHLSIMPE